MIFGPLNEEYWNLLENVINFLGIYHKTSFLQKNINNFQSLRHNLVLLIMLEKQPFTIVALVMHGKYND